MHANTPTVPYTETFYETYAAESLASARAVVPLVLELVAPRSVVDLGCGIGTWLRAFSERGVSTVLGVDGAHVATSQLLISAEQFRAHDLRTPFTAESRFDLAMSVEVAEHLPAAVAPAFVASLVRLAPVVLFSAAIPHQGGDDHINERWPEYWAELFRAHDYHVLDCLRPRLWNRPDVAYYYAQNAFLFVHESERVRHPSLAAIDVARGPLARVHPSKWEEAHDPRRQPLRRLVKALPYAFAGAVRRRLQGLTR